MHWSHWFSHISTFHWIRIPNCFSIVKSGTFSLKMRKSNSSENKKVKCLMFCPRLQRKSETPWNESKATWATLISDACARQVRSRKHLLYAKPSSRKTSERRRKRRKVRRQARRVIRIWLNLSFSLERKSSSGFEETIFLVLKRYLLVFALVLYSGIFNFCFCLVYVLKLTGRKLEENFLCEIIIMYDEHFFLWDLLWDHHLE